MSERLEIAKRVYAFLSDNNLTEVYSGQFKKHKERPGKEPLPIYVILFAKARTLDGQIEIYGKNFMKLDFQTAYRDMPSEDTIIFKSEENLIDFLKTAFVEYKFDEAYKLVERNK